MRLRASEARWHTSFLGEKTQCECMRPRKTSVVHEGVHHITAPDGKDELTALLVNFLSRRRCMWSSRVPRGEMITDPVQKLHEALSPRHACGRERGRHECLRRSHASNHRDSREELHCIDVLRVATGKSVNGSLQVAWMMGDGERSTKTPGRKDRRETTKNHMSENYSI